VVNTSIYEGFGLPLVEGLGIGKDLIVPDLPVFREVLSTFPNFFESRSQASLIDCLDQFAPSINAETAKKFVRDRYDWEKFRDSFRRLYSEISSSP
jgi:glycosyltransferase involved in cell wall biosynthesis